MNGPFTGGCQCGAVRYRAERLLDNAHICHCRMCQKAVGNLFAALIAAPREALHWTRGQPAVFRSSEHVDRGFCAQCGTPLFYDGLNSPRVNLTIGSLDHPEELKPVTQDGIEGRMPWFAELPVLPEIGTTESQDESWAAAIKRTSRQHPDNDTTTWPPAGGTHAR